MTAQHAHVVQAPLPRPPRRERSGPWGRATWLLTILAVLTASLTIVSEAAPAEAQAAPGPDVFVPGPVNRTVVGTKPPLADAELAQRVEEVERLRNRTSRTFLTSDGYYETELFTEPINYQDAGGAWQPIDTSLITSGLPAGVAAQIKAAGHRLVLPPTLATGIFVGQGAATAGFKLRGAAGRLRVEGSTATYEEAFPGVDVAYTATPAGVKEDVILASAAAPTTYVFDLTLPAGVSARNGADGAVELLLGSQVVFRFDKPFMTDASESLAGTSSDVSLTVSGSTMTLAANPAWLAAPERQWPVVIDPTGAFVDTGYSPTQDCYIRSGSQATVSRCGESSLVVGRENNETMRSVLRFDTSAIRSDTQVLQAQLQLHNYGASSTTTAVQVEAHALVESFDSAATWNRRNAATSWSAPGGTIYGQYAKNPSIGPGPATDNLFPTELVQQWVTGSAPNNGLLLKAADETVTTSWVGFDSSEHPNGYLRPYLFVKHQAWLGTQPFYNFEGRDLTDTLGLQVNVANGNLVLSAQDVAVTRTYNSLAGFAGTVGANWGSAAADVDIDTFVDGSISVNGPGGWQAAFQRDEATGNFRGPPWFRGNGRSGGYGTFVVEMWDTGEEWMFHPYGFLLSRSDRNGNTIDYFYTDDRLTSVRDPEGRVTTFAYGANGLISTMTDPVGRVVRYGYTGNELITVTDAAGKLTRYGYDNGDLTEIVTPNLNKVRISYDSWNRVETVRYVTNNLDNTGPLYRFVHYPGSTTVVDPLNQRTNYDKDPKSLIRITRVTDALGHPQSSEYSSTSNVVAYTDAIAPGAKTTRSYSSDGNDNLTSIELPTGARSEFAYTDTNNRYAPSSSKDSQGNSTATVYNTAGNPTRSSWTNGGVNSQSTVTYQGEGGVTCGGDPGQACRATDARGVVTGYTYDADANLTRIDHPAPLGDEVMSYDGIGRMTSRTDGKGQRTTYGYDALDRPISVTYPATGSITYGYGGDGNLTSRSDNTGVTAFRYDRMNRIETKDLPGTAPTMESRYDAASNLKSYADAGGTVNYGYDAANRLTSLTDPQGAQFSFGYNNNNQRTRTTYPSGTGVQQNLSYDPAGRVDTISAVKNGSTVLYSYDYDYTVAGNCVCRIDTGLRQSYLDQAGRTTTYRYDARNQLTSATAPEGTYAYEYDATGNRTAKQNPGTTRATYQYNAADQLTATNGGAQSYFYDGNGNETSNPRRTAAFNDRDQTTSITPTGGAALNLSYADAGQPERVSAGSTNFTTSVLGLASGETGGSFNHYTRDNAGNLLGRRNGTTKEYYLFDGLGSVVALVNAFGTETARYSYDPYGSITSATGANANSNPWRYAGGYHDTTTGLTKFGARYYDPIIGRWTQRDPSGQDANAYTYVGGDPASSIDPDGLFRYCTGVPDRGLSFNFTEACKAHDLCYRRTGSSACHERFYDDLHNHCDTRSIFAQPFCRIRANYYYTGGRLLSRFPRVRIG